MRRALKRAVIAVVALLALVLVARVLLDRWGERRLAEHRKTLEIEIAAERDRIAELRMPVVSGTPIDENAATGYKRVFETVRGIERGLRNSRRHEVLFGTPSHPHDPISPDQTAILDLLREPIRELRRAVRSTRCDWGLRFEDAELGSPIDVAGRIAFTYLILEGHERAQLGDGPGAAGRYLDAVRFTSDLQTNSPHYVHLELTRSGLRALGDLVVAGGLHAELLKDVESRLAILESSYPSAADRHRIARIHAFASFDALSPTWLYDDVSGSPQVVVADDSADVPDPVHSRVPAALRLLIPYRALTAHAVLEADPAYREIGLALESDDQGEAKRVGDALDARREAGSWNPGTEVWLRTAPRPDAERARFDEVTAWFRLVRAAAQLERQLASTGSHADERAGISSEIPIDPFALPDPLRCEILPNAGYRLWSVGQDGRDDGGVADDDIVLERTRTDPDNPTNP